MAAQLLTLPYRPVINLQGAVESGATLEVYQTGTTTPVTIYSDSGLTTPLSNPLTADSLGAFPAAYWDDTTTIRIIIKDAGGTTLDDTDPYVSDAASAETFRDEAAASAAAAATSETNAATSATNAATSETNAAASATSAQNAANEAASVVYAAQTYGQSGARRRANKVSTSFSSKLVMFNGGSDVEDFGSFSNDTQVQDVSEEMESFTSFSIPDDTEGWGPGLGYSLGLDSSCKKIAFFHAADGSRHFRELKKGTNRWHNMLNGYRRQRALLSVDYADVNLQPLMIWDHSEADADTTPPGGGGSESEVSAAQYLSILQQVRDDLRFDLTNIFRRDMTTLPLFVSPLIGQTLGDGSLNVQEAYIDAIADSGIIILPPKYQLFGDMETDGIHLGGQGQRHFSELTGQVVKRVLREGGTYQAPHITSAAINGSAVDCTYATPDNSDLVIDTTTFADPALETGALYGVRYYDASAAGYATISSITVSGQVMTVTPNVTPASGDRIEVAQQPWGGGTQPNTETPRSNIRCGMSVTTEDGTTLYHYALSQRITV